MAYESGSAEGFAQLELHDYKRIMRLLEECGSARSLGAFREAVLDGLARHLGHRNTTFFVGETPAAIPADPSPLTNGRPTRMVSAYTEHFHHLDPIACLLRGASAFALEPLTLERATDPHRPVHREYLERFMFPHRIHAKMVIPVHGPTAAAGIGILAEEADTFGPTDLARAAALAPHISNLFALHLGSAEAPVAGLTERQAEVARMAAAGATNRQIAAALFITVDTVKKHLSSVYSAVGCSSRTQLAAMYRTSDRPTDLMKKATIAAETEG